MIGSILVLILSVNNSCYLMEDVHSTVMAEESFKVFYMLFTVITCLFVL